MTKCPVCKRRPSNRVGTKNVAITTCRHPIHDLADLAPELAGRLLQLMREYDYFDHPNQGWFDFGKLLVSEKFYPIAQGDIERRIGPTKQDHP